MCRRRSKGLRYNLKKKKKKKEKQHVKVEASFAHGEYCMRGAHSATVRLAECTRVLSGRREKLVDWRVGCTATVVAARSVVLQYLMFVQRPLSAPLAPLHSYVHETWKAALGLREVTFTILSFVPHAAPMTLLLPLCIHLYNPLPA